MDLITSRWCHICMSGNQPPGCTYRTSMCLSECVGQDQASSGTAAEGWFVWCATGVAPKHSCAQWVRVSVSPTLFGCAACRLLFQFLTHAYCYRTNKKTIKDRPPVVITQGRKTYCTPQYLSFPSGLDINGFTDSRRRSGTGQCTYTLKHATTNSNVSLPERTGNSPMCSYDSCIFLHV